MKRIKQLCRLANINKSNQHHQTAADELVSRDSPITLYNSSACECAAIIARGESHTRSHTLFFSLARSLSFFLSFFRSFFLDRFVDRSIVDRRRDVTVQCKKFSLPHAPAARDGVDPRGGWCTGGDR